MDASWEIVDAHMHLWTPETHPWVNKSLFEKTYQVKHYRADIAGYNVSQCVHVEAEPPGDPVTETKCLDDIADREGFPNAIVGHCDLSVPNVDDILRHHSLSNRMRGIRQILTFDHDYPQFSQAPHDNFLTDKDWLQGYGLLEKYNMSFEMAFLPTQMKRAADVVKQHPNIMVMINHCGLPYVRDEPTMKIWREGLQELSRYPNVYCKASGMFYTDPKWDQASVNRMVNPVLEMFGFDRTIFSSNFPVDRIYGTFPQLIDALRVILQPFSAAEQRKFFADNAKKFYRL